DPFAGEVSRSGVANNGAPTGLAVVMRRSLSSQTPVSGTLGYAGAWTVAVPAGTSATDLQQVKQQETSARASYGAARAVATGDEQTLAAARAALRAAQLRELSDARARMWRRLPARGPAPARARCRLSRPIRRPWRPRSRSSRPTGRSCQALVARSRARDRR